MPKWPRLSGTLCSDNKRLEFFMTLAPRAPPPPGADIPAVGADAPYPLHNVLLIQAPRQQQPIGRQSLEPTPRKRRAGAAIPRSPGVHEVEVRGKIVDGAHRLAPLHAKGLDHFPLPPATIFRLLLAVKLKPPKGLPAVGKGAAAKNIPHLFPRLLNEDGDVGYRGGQRREDLARPFGSDGARARRIEVKPQQIGAAIHSLQRVRQIRDTANLDLHHFRK